MIVRAQPPGPILKFPDFLTTQDFLRKHWQKQSLHIPGGITRELPSLSPDELGWLATLEDVESRLVFTERSDGKTVYRVEDGPFADKELQALPTTNWTLLVQDVEKHLPDFRAYFDLTEFVPDWRIDDVMVSFATPGGSVGPHRDNYDVFLCQGAGTRTWHLAERDSVREAEGSGALRLLEEFGDQNPILAEAGDILYLPPGVPHWGISTTACMTYSIGMRAPTRDEIVTYLDNSAAPDAQLNDNTYFCDPDLNLEEAVPGLISKQALERTRVLLGEGIQRTDSEIAAALGRTVTELKPWITPAAFGHDEANKILKTHGSEDGLTMHGMARLAWFDASSNCQVFANGYCRNISYTQTALIGDICAYRGLDRERLQHAVKNDANVDLLRWCIQKGLFDV